MYFEHYANMFQDNLNHNKTFGSTAEIWDQDGRQRKQPPATALYPLTYEEGV